MEQNRFESLLILIGELTIAAVIVFALLFLVGIRPLKIREVGTPPQIVDHQTKDNKTQRDNYFEVHVFWHVGPYS